MSYFFGNASGVQTHFSVDSLKSSWSFSIFKALSDKSAKTVLLELLDLKVFISFFNSSIWALDLFLYSRRSFTVFYNAAIWFNWLELFWDSVCLHAHFSIFLQFDTYLQGLMCRLVHILRMHFLSDTYHTLRYDTCI